MPGSEGRRLGEAGVEVDDEVTLREFCLPSVHVSLRACVKVCATACVSV